MSVSTSHDRSFKQQTSSLPNSPTPSSAPISFLACLPEETPHYHSVNVHDMEEKANFSRPFLMKEWKSVSGPVKRASPENRDNRG